MVKLLLAAAALAQLSAAHFSVEYPYWRGDSFEGDASQWIWPCANVSQVNSTNNRTTWPLTGGSVVLDVHHQWAPTYINLGIGNEVVATFNTALVPLFNQTGNGTFCIREVGRATLQGLVDSGNITDGTNATLQFIQIGTSGSALYNCADITFRNEAQLLAEDQCANSTNVGGVALVNADASPTESGAGSEPTGAAGILMVNGGAVGFAAAVAAALLW